MPSTELTRLDLDASSPSPVRRPRRAVRVLAALAAVLCVSAFLAACETAAEDRAQVVNHINAQRARAGAPALRQNSTLNDKADRWAANMRDRCAISHSRLSDGVPANWQRLGENVGRGGSIGPVQTAFMNSPGHRKNILDRGFNQVGVGAVWGTCGGQRMVFVVHVFMRA